MLNEVIYLKNIFKTAVFSNGRNSLIQIIGMTELLAEGCGEILSYDENQVIFKAATTICVEGQKLYITNLDNSVVSIKGVMKSIRFGV